MMDRREFVSTDFTGTTVLPDSFAAHAATRPRVATDDAIPEGDIVDRAPG
jgi:hypothetical protein